MLRLVAAAGGHGYRRVHRCRGVRGRYPFHFQQTDLQRDVARSASTAALAQAAVVRARQERENCDKQRSRDFFAGKVSRAEFVERQERLAQLLGPSSLAVLVGAPVHYRGADIPYPFKQAASIFYFTGFSEENAICFISTDDACKPHTTLMVQESDPAKELWHGVRVGAEMTMELYPVDAAIGLSSLTSAATTLLKACSKLYYTPDQIIHRKHQERLEQLLTCAGMPHPRPLHPLVDQLRMRKSEAELAMMAEISHISSQAFRDGMSRRPNSELILASTLEAGMKKRGAHSLAYPPVVAGGGRGNTLHYLENSQPLDPTETVLVDSGGEKHGYCSDITRTWPVGGKFSDAQLAVYEAVLRIQKELIDAAVVDGSTSLFLLEGLLLRRVLEELDVLGVPCNSSSVRKFIPHSVGHPIGLDVHDCPSVAGNTPFEDGMVITVEPGIYFRPDRHVPKELWGLAVRIEDVVAFRNGRTVVLTETCPKEVHELQAVIRNRQP